jgi:anti-sigma-K factor RskA
LLFSCGYICPQLNTLIISYNVLYLIKITTKQITIVLREKGMRANSTLAKAVRFALISGATTAVLSTSAALFPKSIQRTKPLIIV